MTAAFSFDVFLSYKSDDRLRVSRLAERLRKSGLRVWLDQEQIKPGDVYWVVRTRESIRWMNLTHYLKTRPDKVSRQIVFDGEKLDATAVWRLRDRFIPPGGSPR